MSKDRLFLLPPGFEAHERREFCPECAELWGVLHYYPAIKVGLEVHYVTLSHPRDALCALLGESRWNAPTLVLSSQNLAFAPANVGQSQGHHYLDSARAIATYFANRFGTAHPRGS